MLSSNTTETCDLMLSSSTIFLCQNAAIIFLAPITSVLLQPFGVPLMVSQLLIAILLGPTFLGRIINYKDYMFPTDSQLMLVVYSKFGMILQIFIIGIQTDPAKMIANLEPKIIVISCGVVFLPLVLSFLSAHLIYLSIEGVEDVGYNPTTLFLQGAIFAMNSYPVIATYLHEVKIINSEFSRVAFSCAMLSGFLSYGVRMVGYVLGNFPLELLQYQQKVMLISSLLLLHVLAMVVAVCFVKPFINWVIKGMPNGQEISNGRVFAVIILALALHWPTETIGIQPHFAVYLFGLAVPTESPLGSAIVETLHFFINWMFMPVYYMLHGLRVNMFAIELKRVLYLELMVLFSWIAKFLGALLPALYYNMPIKEATLLGIILNVRGFLELGYLRTLEKHKIIDHGSYTIQCFSILVTTGSLAPIVRHLYNSIMQWKLCYIGNIQHSEQSSELRVLACMFDEENVPAMIHLFKAISHPKDCPIMASVVHLVNIVGHAAPSFVSHKKNKKMPILSVVTQRILSVFKVFEKNEKRAILINPYTVASPYPSIHNDVFIISIKEMTSLIILPFHEHYCTGMNVDIRMVNTNILAKSPCSVGILMDRGCLGGLKYVFESWVSYRVLVLFFGGPDDREALALGERMLGNTTVDLTVIRFCRVGYKIKRTDDTEMVDEFLQRTTGNDRMTFISKDMNDCAEVIRVIEAMGEQYELVILGRRHDESSLLDEYVYTNTYPELGIIGNIFKNSDYGGNASILVVQQQLHIVEAVN